MPLPKQNIDLDEENLDKTVAGPVFLEESLPIVEWNAPPPLPSIHKDGVEHKRGNSLKSDNAS